MDKLSQELIDAIVGYVDDIIEDDMVDEDGDEKPSSFEYTLTDYATVSRKWQRAVESIRFKSFTIPESELDDAEAVFGASGGRWRYVREIVYSFYVRHPDCTEEDEYPPLTERSRKAVAKIQANTPAAQLDTSLDFYSRVSKLLGFVNRHWDEHNKLTVNIQCHMSPAWSSKKDIFSSSAPAEDWILPKTPAIHIFQLKSGVPDFGAAWATGVPPEYRLHHAWMSMIETAMPNLEHLGWRFGEPHGSLNNHDDTTGNSAADLDPPKLCLALAALDLSHLQSLELELDDCDTMLPAAGCMDESRPEYTNRVVPLNTALRNLSTRLRHLRLVGYFDLTPEFFWPHSPSAPDTNPNPTDSNPQDEPHWPLLQTLSVEMTSHRHLGRGRRKGKLDSVERFNPKLFDRLTVAVSRALLRMPKLESYRLSAVDQGWRAPNGGSLLFEVRWESKGVVTWTGTGGFEEEAVPDYERYFGFETEFAQSNSPNSNWMVPEEVKENWRELCQFFWRRDSEGRQVLGM